MHSTNIFAVYKSTKNKETDPQVAFTNLGGTVSRTETLQDIFS